MTTLIKAFPRGHFADKPLCSFKFFHRIARQLKNKLTNRCEILPVVYHIVGRNPIVFDLLGGGDMTPTPNFVSQYNVFFES